MAKNKRFEGVTKAEDDPRSVEEILSTIVSMHPIELEERIGSLSKPLMIECACPGWQPRQWPPATSYPVRKPVNYVEGGIRYPAVPVSLDEQAGAMVEAVNAGCQIAHIHPRDPKDAIATHSVRMQAEVYDRIFAQVDCLNIQHTWEITEDGGIDYISMASQLMELAGGSNKYCQGAVVLWPVADSYPSGYVQSVQAGVRFMEEHQIKPVQKFRGSYHARKMMRDLLDPGVLTQKPYVLVHDMGHPFGWTMDINPWWPIDMITNLEQTRLRFGDDCVMGVYSGGRNWMPITMMAILMGADLVRVGIEDYYWMYPHTDEVIQRNIDCVNKILDFCKLIGRPLATPAQARAMLGMVRT